MLDKEKELLNIYCTNCMKYIADEDGKFAAYRKLKHSLQVYGAGNFIIKHEDYYLNKSADFIKTAKMAVLLHDIGRFEEIKSLCDGVLKFDHSLQGSKILKTIPDYSDIRITLPIKHHGHMPDAFYNDEEYTSITDAKLKEEVEQIFWLVRDADKIANLALMTREPEYLIKNIFFNNALNKADDSKPILYVTPKAKADFLSNKIVNHKDMNSLVDRLLQVLALKFELYYATSQTFLTRLKINEKLWNIFADHCDDKDLMAELKDSYDKHGETTYKP